jgi:hypothetical protein
MKGVVRAGMGIRARKTAFVMAVALLLCLSAAMAPAQRQGKPHPAFGARAGGFHGQANRNEARPRAQNQLRYGSPAPQYRNPTPQSQGYRPAPENAPSLARPVMPGQSYQGRGYTRPPYPGVGNSYAPPGHLGAWLNAHRGVPTQQQEQMLRNDPSFNRLPQGQQQRLMQQLNRVDQMPEAQRERRLARAENIERLSPQQRSQLQESGRLFHSLPDERQAAIKNAFRDLRNVPPDQRQTVLDSARYQNAFNLQERGILSNMLSVEPYQPPR